MAYNLLKGKKGIIFGALDEKSIAWKVALKANEEGAEFVLTNAPLAMRMGEINKLAEECNAQIIPADATSVEDLENLFQAGAGNSGRQDRLCAALHWHEPEHPQRQRLRRPELRVVPENAGHFGACLSTR